MKLRKILINGIRGIVMLPVCLFSAAYPYGAGASKQPDQAPAVNDTVLRFEKEVTDLVNEIRVKNGLSPLTRSFALCRVARYKSQDMLNKMYFSHTSPTYGSPFEMMDKFGITYMSAGENIAMGQPTPKEVVTAWMNSPHHRENIMNASFTEIGVGFVENGRYWTQMFIGK